jgi:sodium/hydrogen antiporter
VAGILIGRLLARVVFGLPDRVRPADFTDGFVALAGTLVAYGFTELIGAYGFIAVFVCGVVLRDYERHHEYYEHMHAFVEQMERILTVGLLVLLGGAVAGGLLLPLTTTDVVAGVALLLLVRPVAGLLGLVGSPMPPAERGVVAFFGIRGIGSLYYLAHALNQADFADPERIWALVGFVVVASVALHGITAGPTMKRLERAD